MPRRLEPIHLPEIPAPSRPNASETRFLQEMTARISPVVPDVLRGPADPERGIPLHRARFYFGSEAHVEWAADLNTRIRKITYNWTIDWSERFKEDQRLRQELTMVIGHLETSLLKRLLAGELVAYGFSSHAPLDAPARAVLPERWATLTPNFTNCSAAGPGLQVSGIRVFDKEVQSTTASSIGRLAEAHLRRWYCNWVEENQRAGRMPSRDDDLVAAKAACGNNVTHSMIRALRKEFAPEAWRAHGRRAPESPNRTE